MMPAAADTALHFHFQSYCNFVQQISIVQIVQIGTVQILLLVSPVVLSLLFCTL